jgi:hypothetical protein
VSATSERRISRRTAFYLGNGANPPFSIGDGVQAQAKSFAKLSYQYFQLGFLAGLFSLDNPAEFDEAIALCNEIAESSSDTISHAQFAQHLQRQFANANIHNNISGLYRIYQALKEAKDNGRDSIWAFILQNSYKPVFLKQQFEFVIGNPPWLTYADVANATYQQELQELAQNYALIPANKANKPQLEIAAIFFAHSANYFLKSGGTIAFVLPRSFLTADQHDNTRSGQAKGFQLTEIWDLDKVTPLFRVPATVLFAHQSAHPEAEQRAITASGIKGFSVNGKLESSHLHWDSVKQALKFAETNWFYSRLSKNARKTRSALTTTEPRCQATESYYAPLFKQGATIVPRSFYFVESEQALPSDLQGRILPFKTSESILRAAKMPWKTLTLKGRINTHFLFYTALGKNLAPFTLINPPLVLLPILVNSGFVIELKSADELFEQGEIETAKWFKKAQELWDDNKTVQNKQNNVSLYDYLNWQNKLLQQNINMRYLVIYTASARDASAVIIEREDFDLEFMVESKAYWFATNDSYEAYYLTCFLNSGYTNYLIKDFQSRGLFGPRDIHKKILDLPFPKFDSNNDSHRQLAELGKQCAIKAKNVVGDDKFLDLATHQLGRLRRIVRQALSVELKKIDALVEDISQGRIAVFTVKYNDTPWRNDCYYTN